MNSLQPLLLGMCLLLCLGCGPRIEYPKDPDALPFVQCKVEMNGALVPNAIIELHTEGIKGQNIVGMYDSEYDCYRFVTAQGDTKKAGVPEGEYVVTVKLASKGNLQIPAKYKNPSTSGLTIEVVEGDNFLEPISLSN